MMTRASGNWWLNEKTSSNAVFASFPRWAATFDQITAVPIRPAVAIFGDKTAGTYIRHKYHSQFPSGYILIYRCHIYLWDNKIENN